MSPIEASCPACGAVITFKTGSSVVVICDFCHSAVARGDRKLEDLGKVAELVETGSPLQVGLRGSYRGVPFELTGRAQLEHEAGGIWDEWYAAFADGRWGWLAEAQGRFYLTFQKPLSDQTLIAPFQYLELGQPVPSVSGAAPLVVAEKGTATALGARGEIPYRLVPGEQYAYADLSGPRGEFATIDYGEEQPAIFVGQEATLAELGISPSAPTPEREARRVSAVQLSCPQCAGPLELRAPDKTERVTCPNCGSLLDVNQGRLKFLKSLNPAKVIPIIPLGSVGEFDSVKLTVIGFMQRSVEFSGVRYYWEEYLLYNPQVGFRWLVRSDDHWNFVEPLPPGAVLDQGRTIVYDGKRFKLYQDATARVEHVLGEFYWRVSVGEQVQAWDYIRPPMMLSKEISGYVGEPKKGSRKTPPSVKGGEINWSLGTYVKRRQIEKRFGLKGLPDPSTVGPNQPFTNKAIYKYWAFLLVATLVFGIAVMAMGERRKVFESTYTLQPLKSADDSQVIFADPFELKDGQNIKITATSNVDNSWLYVEGDLIEESTGLVQAFSAPIEYYHGSDSDGSWSEGGQSTDVHLSALPSGKYALRLEAGWEKWQGPAVLSVRVEQGVPRVAHLMLALVLISVVPLIVGIYHFSFEQKRWKDSDYSPYGSG
ncbi:MAG TPA: DUF4178 domain-containing protein [Blastocatellia bacterium]|nr:DUF4178 domain-containing protein [Blastocatellia bacterium]